MNNVEIVQFFNGEERRVWAKARTANGVRAAMRAMPSGNGWGVKLRGKAESLRAIGAERNAYGQLVFDADPKTDRWVDCEVVS